MLDKILALIVAYRYLVIFPICLVEAPVASIVIGFFAVSGGLSLPLAFPLIVAGDCVGDIALYLIGRLGRKASLRMSGGGKRVARHAARVLRLISQHDRRAIVISKLVHGVGFTGLILAGSVHVRFRRFIGTCLAVTILQSAVLIGVGAVSGGVYAAISRNLGYFNLAGVAAAILVAALAYRSLGKLADKSAAGPVDPPDANGA